MIININEEYNDIKYNNVINLSIFNTNVTVVKLIFCQRQRDFKKRMYFKGI